MANGGLVVPFVDDVREFFVELYDQEEFVIDKTGCKMIEILTAQFQADEESIFGRVDKGYVDREIEWYNSQSLRVYDIPPPIPKQWLEVADHQGYINSNYGWCVHSRENGYQFENVFQELARHKESRRAIMIYNRPSMWEDYNKSGRSDFICCSNVQYFIRQDQLITHVNFRSNDAVFGYKNDYAWQDKVRYDLFLRLKLTYPSLEIGPMIWNAGSLHVYEKHFYLIEHYSETGEWDVTKSMVEAYKNER